MSRNLYILAGSLLLFALISCGMSLLPSSAQPGLPGNGSLWKTTGLFLFLGSLISAFRGGHDRDVRAGGTQERRTAAPAPATRIEVEECMK